jgi:hypothetical protein
MKSKVCANCGNTFDCKTDFDGETIYLYKRKFCTICSPIGSHNTRKHLNGTVNRPAFIDSLSDEEFRELISDSLSRKDFFRKINMMAGGASFSILNRRISSSGVDISHFRSPQSFRKNTRRFSNEAILVENSTYASTVDLKKRLVKDGLINYVCARCGNNGIHNNMKLSLQLDHINGRRNDNRIENLRLLCPNCHSQTDTFCGKGKKQA